MPSFSSKKKSSSHLDRKGNLKMVDVGGKKVTARTAVARCFLTVNQEVIQALGESRLAKGNAIACAQAAGILAAKKTAELIPLCHTIGLDYVDIRIRIEETGPSPLVPLPPSEGAGGVQEIPSPLRGEHFDRLSVPSEVEGGPRVTPPPQSGGGVRGEAGRTRILVEAEVSTHSQTGVEMEALTAASIAALTLYDMAKALDRGMVIEGLRLVKKTGGRSGTYAPSFYPSS